LVKEIVLPEGFYPASSFFGLLSLDSGQKPAGMTLLKDVVLPEGFYPASIC